VSHPYPDGRSAILQLLGSRPVAYYPALAAIAGGVCAGVFLAQLFYWHDKGADPDGWILRTHSEWEAGLTRREQETAQRKLRERGMLKEKRAGMPARLHCRLDVDAVIARLSGHQGSRGAGVRRGGGGAGGGGQDWRKAPDQFGGKRQTRLAESAKQDWRKAPDKYGGKRQTCREYHRAQQRAGDREHSSGWLP
jgi:hypothetical protein